MEAFGGATWSGGGWSVRIDFEDSYVCGGSNFNTQTGTASRRVCLSVPTRLTVQMIGMVERQDFGFEYAEARVNGMPIASGGSLGEGLGCAMAPTSAFGTIDLPAGEHLIELFSSTNDPLYHVGAFWEFHFTWEPL
jgi:hypothetical protein